MLKKNTIKNVVLKILLEKLENLERRIVKKKTKKKRLRRFIVLKMHHVLSIRVFFFGSWT